MSVIKKESRRLGETTSLKGIARILKSTHLSLRILWMVSVIVFLSMAFYQSALLIAQYLRFPEITDLDEHSVDLVDDDDEIELPHLTLCNLNPISERAYGAGLETFFREVKEAPHWLSTANDTFAEHHEVLTDELLSPRGFYAAMGKNISEYIGHSQEEFLASCKILMLEGLDIEEEDCRDYGHIKLFQHPKYFNCYQISMGKQTPEDLMVGYSVTLQLGNYNTKWLSYMPSQRKYQLGAMIVLTEPGTYPMTAENGHHVAPGIHVSLRYRLEARNHMPAPYGHCEKHEQFEEKLREWANINMTYQYTKNTCVSLNLEKFVLDECGCVDYTLMQILHDYGDARGCGHTHHEDRLGAIHQMLCARHVRRSRLQEAISMCSAPCHELRYIPEISESVWPPGTLTEDFYNELIKGKPYEDKLIVVQEAVESKRNNASTTSGDKRSAAMTLVRENFVNINVYLGRLRVLDISDAPKITFTSLLSQLGGMLNLWAGITIVLIIEFVEFLLRTFVLPSEP